MIGISTRFILSAALVVGGVGAFDAFVSAEWDLFVVFLMIISLQLILWLRSRANRIPVSIRPDLAHWLERRSQRTGEPFDDLLDRALAWYQHGLFVNDRPDT